MTQELFQTIAKSLTQLQTLKVTKVAPRYRLKKKETIPLDSHKEYKFRIEETEE